MIRRLAQKSYDEKIIRLADKRLSRVRRLTKDYDEIANVYQREHVERQKLIDPVEPTWEQQIRTVDCAEISGERVSGRNRRYTDPKRRAGSLKIRKDSGGLFLSE